MKFKQAYILNSNLRKKQAFLYKCLFKIPLWREIDNVTFFSFLIFSKNLKAVFLMILELVDLN